MWNCTPTDCLQPDSSSGASPVSAALIHGGTGGAKSRSLIAATPLLESVGFKVPNTAVLGSAACATLIGNINFGDLKPENLKDPIFVKKILETIPSAIRQGVSSLVDSIGRPACLAVRSDAVAGDESGIGIYESAIFRSDPGNAAEYELAVWRGILRVLASHEDPAARFFRSELGYQDGIAVMFQPLVGKEHALAHQASAFGPNFSGVMWDRPHSLPMFLNAGLCQPMNANSRYVIDKGHIELEFPDYYSPTALLLDQQVKQHPIEAIPAFEGLIKNYDGGTLTQARAALYKAGMTYMEFAICDGVHYALQFAAKPKVVTERPRIKGNEWLFVSSDTLSEFPVFGTCTAENCAWVHLKHAARITHFANWAQKERLPPRSVVLQLPSIYELGPTLARSTVIWKQLRSVAAVIVPCDSGVPHCSTLGSHISGVIDIAPKFGVVHLEKRRELDRLKGLTEFESVDEDISLAKNRLSIVLSGEHQAAALRV